MNCIQAEHSQAQLLHLTAAYNYSTPNPRSSPFANSSSISLIVARSFRECSFFKPITFHCEIYEITFFSILNKITKKPKEIGKRMKFLVKFPDKKIEMKFRVSLRHLTRSDITQNHRITGDRKDLWRSSCPTPVLPVLQKL